MLEISLDERVPQLLGFQKAAEGFYPLREFAVPMLSIGTACEMLDCPTVGGLR